MSLECPGYSAALSWMPIWAPDCLADGSESAASLKEQGSRGSRAQILSGMRPLVVSSL